LNFFEYVCLAGTTYKCYLFSLNSASLSDAKDICLDFLSNLVTFETSLEFDAVKEQLFIETNYWFWIGYYASCNLGTFTWYYLINNQLANMNMILPWYSLRPGTDCTYNYLLLSKNFPQNNDSYIYDNPDRASNLRRYICEMR
jgi:hypothetical protein